MSLSRRLATLIIEKRTTLEDVIRLLTKYKMLSLLPLIKQSLIRIGERSSRDNTLIIEAPFPLSEEAIKKVRSVVGNPQEDHIVVINKNTLAGFKARFRGKLYDGSAERIIKQLINK